MMVECWWKDLVVGVAQVCSVVWLRPVWRVWRVFSGWRRRRLVGLMRLRRLLAAVACTAVLGVSAWDGRPAYVWSTGVLRLVPKAWVASSLWLGVGRRGKGAGSRLGVVALGGGGLVSRPTWVVHGSGCC